jgi:hypothetical protein
MASTPQNQKADALFVNLQCGRSNNLFYFGAECSFCEVIIKTQASLYHDLGARKPTALAVGGIAPHPSPPYIYFLSILS